MAHDFRSIFAGVGVRTAKQTYQDLINQFTGICAYLSVSQCVRLAFLQGCTCCRSEYALRDFNGATAGDADDTYGTSLCRGNGTDSIFVDKLHKLFREG